MNRIPLFLSLSLVLTLLLSACGSTLGSSTPTAAVAASNTIIAEGHLLPGRFQYLSFAAGGRVMDLPIKQGDKVTQGQVLASLADRQQAQAALAAAQLGLLAAQQNIDLLNRTAGAGQAKAWLAYMDAQKARQLAQLAWDKLDQSSLQTNIDSAQSDLTTRQTDLENAQKDFDKYSGLAIDNPTRKTYEGNLRTAQTNYDLALQKLEDLTNGKGRIRAALDAALAAETEAKRSYLNSQNGADSDKLALAQAQLDNAKAQTAAAQNALDNYDLKAPFDGTVMEINVSSNQLVGPDIWVVAVADTSQWYVDTTDLNELDVTTIRLGQKVQLSADAVAGIKMTGVVERIGETPRNQGTDILYTVHILVEYPDPRLRWGMTMEVTFNRNE